jgi:hypothetical protein
VADGEHLYQLSFQSIAPCYGYKVVHLHLRQTNVAGICAALLNDKLFARATTSQWGHLYVVRQKPRCECYSNSVERSHGLLDTSHFGNYLTTGVRGESLRRTRLRGGPLTSRKSNGRKRRNLNHENFILAATSNLIRALNAMTRLCISIVILQFRNL